MPFTPASFPPLRRALRQWFAAHARDLPWRRKRSLYRTVVSEFMLQQTQVATVLPYFSRWMERFPDFPALARASDAEVLKAWEGLGYYRRARNLHALARHLAENPAPANASAWRQLPGIGPYTAAAIASLVYGEAQAVVDGNVVRVLARLSGDSTAYRDSSAAVRALTPLARAFLDVDHPGTHNEALMELGATVCTKHAPACTLCPFVEHCIATRRGDPAGLPLLGQRTTTTRAVPRLWIQHDGHLLLEQLPAHNGRLAGMLELPRAEALGIDPTHLPLLARKTRGIARERIREPIHHARIPSRRKLPPGLLWVRIDQLDTVTLSGPHRRWVRELLAAQ